MTTGAKGSVSSSAWQKLKRDPARLGKHHEQKRLRDRRKRALDKADPERAARIRELKRERMRRVLATPEGRVRHRELGRITARRRRLLFPEYAAQWARDGREERRWYRVTESSDGTVTRSVLGDLEREALCPYCCEPLTDENRQIDHVAPLTRGGRHSADNLAACCADCNVAKGTLPLIAFLLRRATA